MHEWHTQNNTNILSLINEFIGFTFTTDYGGVKEVKNVRITDKVVSDAETAITHVTNSSYGGTTAYIVTCANSKLTKSFNDLFKAFVTKYNDYINFKQNLTISYGRKAEKVSCPQCHSSINLHYGGKFKVCPICGSKKIISDSNWKSLDTKYRMVQKASEMLQTAAIKNNAVFVCGIEWHC